MAHYHLILFLVGVSALMTAINLMEAKPVPARPPSRRSSSSFANFHRSLFGSMDDMSAIPTVMVMPSFVYYQIMSSIHSPFHRMVKSAKWSAMKDSSEEQDDEEELDEEMKEPEEMEEMEEENEESEFEKKEVKKSTAKNSSKDENKKEKEKFSEMESKKEKEAEKDSKIDPVKDTKETLQSVKEDKPSNEEVQKEPLIKEAESQKESQVKSEEEQEESVTNKSENEDNSEKEPLEESENEKEESVTEESENPSEKEEEIVTTETPSTESPSQESTLALIIETTTEVIDERMLSATPTIVNNNSAKNLGRPSMTYVCKYGKCQHNAEAKKLLEQEIEAELWAKL